MLDNFHNMIYNLSCKEKQSTENRKEAQDESFQVKRNDCGKRQTYKGCAAAIHVSPQTFTKKMRGATIFDIEEANNLGDFLEMTGKEKIDIFLS